MIKTKGYFLLHRSIWNNPIVTKDIEHFVVWIYILSQVEWESGREVDFKGKKITLKAGQMTIGVRSQMLKDLQVILPNLTKDKLYRILECYTNATQIATQKSSKCTLITVVNWNKYQKNATRIATQMRPNEINVNKAYEMPATEVPGKEIKIIPWEEDYGLDPMECMRRYEEQLKNGNSI